MKYFIHTTGCRANQWDSHVIEERMTAAGHTGGPLPQADFIIINACTVTEGAERDARRFINRCRRENKGGKVILVGCHPQAYPDEPLGADLILGQTEKFDAETFLTKVGRVVKDSFPQEPEKASPPSTPLQRGKTRFFYKIQDGCDCFCSYCIVPFARGAPRSRPAAEIVDFLKSLKEMGIKEVVLTGIEISAYRDPADGRGLKELLSALDKSETPERIRLSSIDPVYIDDDFMEIIGRSKKMAKSIHIPLQSASDRVLSLMKRRYSRAFVEDVIARMTRTIPDVGIGLDVIAGFPGEDEDDFEETFSLIQSWDIFYLHVFPFSARPGTAASTMDGGPSGPVRKERVRRLKDLDAQKRKAFCARFVGKEKMILMEGKLYGGLYRRGYTDNYIPVYTPFWKSSENTFVKVRIEGVENGLPMGVAIDG